MKCFFTNDVEHTSVNGKTYERIADEVEQNTLPRLLDLYEKYNVRSTFFVLGSLAEIRPNIVRMIYERGQEVASHGYLHDYTKAFDVLSLEEQISELKLSKEILEQIIGDEVVSFRAPALRVNEYTPLALEEAGYKFDSSVAPQRLDAFMSLGSKKKRSWLKAPRMIYNTAQDNLARLGNSSIVEVPVSSYGVPYIGTVMRISPRFLTPITRQLLFLEAKGTNKPINFLFHPSEAVEELAEESVILNRSKSVLGHLFADIMRSKLKMRNLNDNALILLEKELKFWSEKGGDFIQVKEANFDKQYDYVI